MKLGEQHPSRSRFSRDWLFISAALAMFFLAGASAAQAQTFTVLHNFTGGLDGSGPQTGLTIDRAGNLYGTARYGGTQANDCHITSGCGTIFELSRQGSGFIFRPLYQFQGFPSGDGANPLGRVIFGSDGALYGTTAFGGQNGDGCGSEQPGCGIVYKVSPPPTFCKSFTCNWDETILYSFTGDQNGDAPFGEIAFDTAGNLYGTTYAGGLGSGGAAYELTPAKGAWTLSVLARFESGTNPYGGVQLDQAGNVYLTTTLNEFVYQLAPSGSNWTLNTLYLFDEGDGIYDQLAGVIVGPGGNLFGGTNDQSPVVFELSPSGGGWSYNPLYSFSGGGLSANLVMDSAGNLYGTTYGGGQGNYGSVFKLAPSNGGWTYTDLHDFTGGSDGGDPLSSIVIDSHGNLYGTASIGGGDRCSLGFGCGVVWEITP